MPRTQTQAKQSRGRAAWSLASVALTDAYTDFILSRQAMNCTPVTMVFYRFTAGKFLEWIERQGLTGPEQVTARHVRQYLAELAEAARADEFMKVIERAYKAKKPAKEDLQTIRKFLIDYPEFCRAVFSMTEATQQRIIKNWMMK